MATSLGGIYNSRIQLSVSLMSSTENGEKAKKTEPEPEVKEEEPAEEEEITVKTKAKKSKKTVEQGFELWNELEIQRVKFMVSALLL